MKVIDLLNKIANGEESDLTTEFEFDKRIWNFYKLQDSEFCIDGWMLNQEIVITKHKEILEEKKILEKLNLDIDELKGKETPRAIDYLIESKINQVIDYLKSKGE